MRKFFELCDHERERQIFEEGFKAKHDDLYRNGELARAAACYAMPPCRRQDNFIPFYFPFELRWFKSTPLDRKRELVKAAALLCAEFERLEREEQQNNKENL